MNIYVITAGMYEDYRIVGCTTDSDTANAILEHAKKNPYDGYCAVIETFEDCKDSNCDYDIGAHKFFHVGIIDKNIIKGYIGESIVSSEVFPNYIDCLKILSSGPIINGFEGWSSVTLTAKDGEEAVKIALDAIQHIKS